MARKHSDDGIGSPVIKDYVLRYSVSAEPLQQRETIQVVVRLPFCLYVPPICYLIHDTATGGVVGFVPQKFWTEKAVGSTVPKVEQVARGKVVYFGDSEVTTDWIGVSDHFQSGPKGRNVEFDKDPTGYFRYTRLTLEMDWTVPSGFDPYIQGDDARTKTVAEQIGSRTLELVNRVIDVYRVAMNDSYIQRVTRPWIEDIRVGIPDNSSIRKQSSPTEQKLTYKCGWHPFAFSMHGLRPAIMNEPRESLESFRTQLEESKALPTHLLLKLDTEGALERLDSGLAIVGTFQYLEVYVEQFYYSKLSPKISYQEIDHLLTRDRNWQLTTRLKELLREQFGKSISDLDSILWENWLRLAKDKRDDFLHASVELNLEEAQEAHRLNMAVVQLLETL